MLELVRPAAKSLLARTPRLFSAGKAIFRRLKGLEERAKFRFREPTVTFIDYTSAEIAQIRSSGFFSQYGQDYYLWNNVFKGQPKGFYVEVGANQPFTGSNSAFLERVGWSGISFDPLGTFSHQWQTQRKNPFHQVAISNKEGSELFTEILSKNGWEHMLSAFSHHVRKEDKDLYGYREYPVRTAPLSAFVPQEQKIDILLIDVEGAERAVLAGIDMHANRPQYLLVENASQVGGDWSLRKEITDCGYRLIARLGMADDLYVATHPAVRWQ